DCCDGNRASRGASLSWAFSSNAWERTMQAAALMGPGGQFYATLLELVWLDNRDHLWQPIRFEVFNLQTPGTAPCALLPLCGRRRRELHGDDRGEVRDRVPSKLAPRQQHRCSWNHLGMVDGFLALARPSHPASTFLGSTSNTVSTL